jgi:sugar/nucleoside kinase (ribokinase family)
MTEATRDVVGIGNAIVDIIGRCDDAFLDAHGAPKGHMRLVDADTISALYSDMGPAIEVSGGSAANTIVGIASLGGNTAYLGKVADDDFGRIFAHDIRAAGVAFDTPAKSGGEPTARSLVLVTPDGERTMNTFLGVSPEFDAADLDAETIASGAILYLEGYLFDRPEAQAAFYKAADIAKQAGRKVSLTLSDGFCVDRHRDSFLEIIRSHVDILFANESELTSLAQVDDFNDAVRAIAPLTPTLAATRSENGSVIIIDGENTPIAIERVSNVADTTGAGDLYAAGVLYGLARGLSAETCGRIGSIAAAEVISHLGARPETNLANLCRQKGVAL